MTGLRFSPPRVLIDENTAWMLCAAFADGPNHDLRPPRDALVALQLARKSELSGRIAARQPQSPGARQEDVLGHELVADYHNNLAVEALLNQAFEKISVHAERLGVPIVAVKFAALSVKGIVKPGSRMAADLDLLVPQSHARALWNALLDSGFARTRTRAHPHQLEALADAYGAVVELHLHLPGVFLDGRLVTAETLIEQRLATRLRGSTFVPNFELLAAHAIAHALVQNRATPQSYSPLRMIADLLDLRHAKADVITLARQYVAPTLRASCDSLERLCNCLSRGTFDGPAFEGTSEQILLWHCIAARHDVGYAERLRAAALFNKLHDGSSVAEVLVFVAGMLLPADAELDALYGPASGGVARLRRRLLRPIDLAIRARQRWITNRSR